MKHNVKKVLKNESGFSLIEIMIAVAIMGILIGIVGPNVLNQLEKSKVSSTKVQMKGIGTALKSYRLDCGVYPTTDQGLDALLTKPASGRECRNYAPGGYLEKRIPQDAWNNDFLYMSDGNEYEIKSLGKDLVEGGVDYDADISSKELD